jgi:hypothetical protein
MSAFLETAKTIGPGVVGAIGGYLVKRWEVGHQARKTENDLWSTQIQSHWSPLLKATRDFKSRFGFLSNVYLRQPGMPFNPDSVSADFRELYMLSPDAINNLQHCDPNAPRKDENSVQKVRTRVCHELTFAESSLYITAKYLGHAERVWRDLNESLLILPKSARGNMLVVISNVRGSLQGTTGAGIFNEQQEYIGEAVWGTNGSVISNLEFRRRLFDLPGWEQFANLLRFFVEFEPKVKYEVACTIKALSVLEQELKQLCDQKTMRTYEALCRSRSRASSKGGPATGVQPKAE